MLSKDLLNPVNTSRTAFVQLLVNHPTETNSGLQTEWISGNCKNTFWDCLRYGVTAKHTYKEKCVGTCHEMSFLSSFLEQIIGEKVSAAKH